MNRSSYILTFKSFVKQFLVIFFVFIISFISFSIYKNEFGLLGNNKNKNIRIYTDEKTTKYLLSFNHIPNNFNGILVGPSLSDQMMDTKKLSNDFDIYNLSMDGGNISELKYAIDNVLKYGDMKLFIICLDPYITKNHGTKSSQINPKEYYSSFASISVIKYYVKKYLDIKKADKSIFYDSYWGYTDNAYSKKDINSTEKINKKLSSFDNSNFDTLNIDKTAYLELADILSTVRKKNIPIIAYYYPIAKRKFMHTKYNSNYIKYRREIDKLLDYKKDIIIDFAQNEYDYIRDNDDSYSDGIHLSKKGANKIIKVLKTKILEIQK